MMAAPSRHGRRTRSRRAGVGRAAQERLQDLQKTVTDGPAIGGGLLLVESGYATNGGMPGTAFIALQNRDR